jgi:secernin
MCDTLVAVQDSTIDGSVFFAKNSDREPNEAHQLLLVERANHPDMDKVKCTYISIPQARHTHAVLLSKPFWIWGAEMGTNEHGVAIGNEAIFTRIPFEKEPGLIGMDLLRLGLERGVTARDALDVMTSLLETYGQGGNCGFTHPLYYHNSFLIADPSEAWVLETAGRYWVAEKVKGIRSISNAITIGEDWDLISKDLIAYAIKRGWCKNERDFHFAHCYTNQSDIIHTYFSDASTRQCRTTDLMRLKSSTNQLGFQAFMAILRDHGENIRLRQSLFGCDVCMHAGFGLLRASQSTGSLVSHLTPGRQTHWITGTAAPCLSIFKPFWFDSGLPEMGPPPTGIFDDKSLWWRHERLHRAVLRDFQPRLSKFVEERDSMEAEFREKATSLRDAPADQRAVFTKESFNQASEALDRWTEAVNTTPLKGRNQYLFELAWRRFNKQANIPV